MENAETVYLNNLDAQLGRIAEELTSLKVANATLAASVALLSAQNMEFKQENKELRNSVQELKDLINTGRGAALT